MAQRTKGSQPGYTYEPTEYPSGIFRAVGPYAQQYLTTTEVRAQEARARRRGHQATVDLAELGDKIRAQRGKGNRTLIRARKMA